MRSRSYIAILLIASASCALAQVAIDKDKYRNSDHNPVEWNVLRNGTKDTLVVHIDDAGGIWGNITGTLSDQADLNSALTALAPIASPTFTGTVTIPNGAALGAPASISRSVKAKTADYPVTGAESGAMFTNTGAAGAVNFTLPTAAAGLTYTFYIDAAQAVTITAAGANTIQLAGSVSAAAGNVSASTSGNAVTIVAISATQWVVISHEGTWTVT